MRHISSGNASLKVSMIVMVLIFGVSKLKGGTGGGVSSSFDQEIRMPRDGEICTISIDVSLGQNPADFSIGLERVAAAQKTSLGIWRYHDSQWHFGRAPEGSNLVIANSTGKAVNLKFVINAAGYWVYGVFADEHARERSAVKSTLEADGAIHASITESVVERWSYPYRLEGRYAENDAYLQLSLTNPSGNDPVVLDAVQVDYEQEFAEGQPALTQRIAPLTIIEYSWTSPDTKYLHDNISVMEQRPLDGVCVRVAHPRYPHGNLLAGAGRGDAGWEVFQNLRLTPEVMAPAIKDLRDTQFSRFRSNYLTVVSYMENEATMDWFDDAWWENIVHNTRLTATTAKKGGCEGIMFDPEEYGCKIWGHGKLMTDPMYAGRSYEEICEKIRQRGREFMVAINEGYPGIRILILHSWEVLLCQGYHQSYKGHWGLLRDFLDGMLEGCDEQTILIDGIENGYYVEEMEDFVSLVRRVKRYGPRLTRFPEKFKKQVYMGFGIWLDRDRSWDAVHIDKNYWSPTKFEKIISNAASASDGFVWLYLERPSWWQESYEQKLGGDISFSTGEGDNRSRDSDIKPTPRVYWTAVENARKKALENRDSNR